MFNIKNKKAIKIESVTFADIQMQESDIEEILRCNIDILCDDEESMLIVGRQVQNEKLGRSDLTAIDSKGNIVLLEIKRDKKDIESRKEAFEFQAIRYAASYATISSIDKLVKKVYAPYIEKYRSEFGNSELTSYELGIRKLNEFLKENGVESNFNRKQRIILVASDYDGQTLSAVAWLSSNQVDISCFKLIPYKIGEEMFFKPEKLLPLTNYSDYYINLIDKSSPDVKAYEGITRRSLPKIDAMLKWGVVKPGDVILAKNKVSEAVLCKNGNVEVGNKEISLQVWLKGIFGWSSIQTYNFAIHKESGKSLSVIREEYMSKQDKELLDERT